MLRNSRRDRIVSSGYVGPVRVVAMEGSRCPSRSTAGASASRRTPRGSFQTPVPADNAAATLITFNSIRTGRSPRVKEEPPNKELERTKTALVVSSARRTAALAAQFRRSPEQQGARAGS